MTQAQLPAEEFLMALGPIPRVLSRTVRAIRNAATIFSRGGGLELHEVLATVTHLVLRAPTNAAVIISAVEEMYPIHLDDYPDLPPYQLTRFLGADETIAVLLLSFLRRRLAQVCDPEQWALISGRMRQQIAIGKTVGERIHGVGGGKGMLLAGLPFIAVGTMLATCPNEFSRYRAAFRSSERLWDTRTEEKIFGISHLEIAAPLSRELGLGALFSTTFLGRHFPVSLEERDDGARVIELCELLQVYGDPAHPACVSVVQTFRPEVSAGLMEKVEEILRNPKVNEWLFASAADDEEMEA